MMLYVGLGMVLTGLLTGAFLLGRWWGARAGQQLRSNWFEDVTSIPVPDHEAEVGSTAALQALQALGQGGTVKVKLPEGK